MDSILFPGTLIADEAMSPAKAKIEAAKAASAAKLGERGMKAPDAANVEIKFASGGEESKDPFAEADAYKARIQEIQAKAAGGSLSKSKSAQLAQLKIMEQKARSDAREKVYRAEEKAAARESERDDGDKFAKITGISIPSF